jgi:biopolymer transport protein ExbB
MSRYSRRSIAVPPFRLAAGLAAALAGTVLLGPAPAAPEPDVTSPIRPAKVAAADAESVSFGELFRKGGPLMYPLAAMSILAVAFAVYGFLVLREVQVVPDDLRRDIVAHLRSGSLREARAACGERPCPMSEITLSALDYLETEDVNAQMLKDLVEGEGVRQAVTIQQQTQYLMDIAVVSPMIGLLGTVFGMIRAFNVVSLDLAKAKPTLLAAGVAEALITTAAGLIIGIPAMLLFFYFRTRASKLISRLESASAEVLTLVLRKAQP